MKTTKILALTVILAISIAGTVTVSAFIKRGPGGDGFFSCMGPGMLNADMILNHMKDKLELSEEQTTKLKPVLEEQLEKWRAMFRKYAGQAREAFKAMRSEHQDMWQEMETQFAEILNDEQLQKVREFHQKRMERFQEMGFRGPGLLGGFHQLIEDLQLSDDQKQELLSIFMKYRNNRQTGVKNFLDIHQKMTETLLSEGFDEQKIREMFQQQTPTLEEMFVEHARMFAEMKAVLTPEQIETLIRKQTEFREKIEQWQGGHSEGHGWF